MSEAAGERRIAAPLADRADALDADPLERVRERVDLAPEEKETTIRFCKRDDRARVHSDEPGITRRLLAHRETVVEAIHVLDGDRPGTAIPPADWNGEPIVGVEATVPVGALQVQLSARTSGSHADVVTDRVYDHRGDRDDHTGGGAA